MLLRSIPNHILNPSSTSKTHSIFRTPKTRSASLTLLCSSAQKKAEPRGIPSLSSDFKELLKQKKKDISSIGCCLVVKEEQKQEEGEKIDKNGDVLGGSCSGGCIGGGGGGGSHRGGGEDGEWGHGSESVDGYYQRMIKAYPQDALVLGNYAKFLKEVRGDAEKAEEYCERAILARGNDEATDGNVLCLYGDLIWETQKDGHRARSYFDQAVQSAPNDCYVLASYARFLWDAGEEEEENDDHLEQQEINNTNTCLLQPPTISVATTAAAAAATTTTTNLNLTVAN